MRCQDATPVVVQPQPISTLTQTELMLSDLLGFELGERRAGR